MVSVCEHRQCTQLWLGPSALDPGVLPWGAKVVGTSVECGCQPVGCRCHRRCENKPTLAVGKPSHMNVNDL